MYKHWFSRHWTSGSEGQSPGRWAADKQSPETVLADRRESSHAVAKVEGTWAEPRGPERRRRRPSPGRAEA